MRGFLWVGLSIVLPSIMLSNPAAAVGERPYWPAVEVREVPEGCIKWNWQELSYYNYCARGVRPNVVRVRG